MWTTRRQSCCRTCGREWWTCMTGTWRATRRRRPSSTAHTSASLCARARVEGRRPQKEGHPQKEAFLHCTHKCAVEPPTAKGAFSHPPELIAWDRLPLTCASFSTAPPTRVSLHPQRRDPLSTTLPTRPLSLSALAPYFRSLFLSSSSLSSPPPMISQPRPFPSFPFAPPSLPPSCCNSCTW